MAEETKVKKERQIYQVPETKEDAVKSLKQLSARLFARLKGKGLTIIESWWGNEDSRLTPAKSLYTATIADICNQINKEIMDALKVLIKE